MENPNAGKTTAVHRLQTITILQYTIDEHRGNDLLFTVFATGGGYNTDTNSSSLSLSLSLYTVALSSLAPTRMTTTFSKFALSHIYTNMTFRLFTNIAPMDSQKHIYEYVPSSGEHSSPGMHHPALAGHSSSGSHRAFLAGYSSSGSH